MTPRDVDALTDDEYQAFAVHMQREAYEIQKAAKRR